ncbi:metalloprotease [Rubritalea marina]|uniref:metalloprotease n=1 Tax=Rubritalea marina TaxID=361055 RepID=UPI000366F037|nr:site-2 protease family protein [Rubritalea marina]
MVELRLFGIPIRVEPSFWITLGIIGLIGTDMRDSNFLLQIALFVIAGFISILIHELGHALMLKAYKVKPNIVLASFGGYATYPAGALSRLQGFLMTAAGPGLQLLLAGAVYLGVGFNSTPYNEFEEFTNILIGISIFWALLNCLPILPMDGGQMLSAILGPRRQAAVHMVGMVTAVIFGFVAFKIGAIFGTIFMGMFAYQNFKAWKHYRS